MNTSTRFIRKALHSVLHFKRGVRYWQLKEKEMLSLSQEPQEKKTTVQSYDRFLTGYKTFVAQTLENYTADIGAHTGLVYSEPLFERFVSLMRREINAEADKLCDTFGEHSGDKRTFRNKLHEMAEAAIIQLTETICCAEAHAV